MLAFASVIASPEKFDRYARPGLALATEPDSVIAEYTDAQSMCSAYNEVLDAFAERDDLEALVLLHEDTELRDPDFCARVRERLRTDPDVAVVGAIGARGVDSLSWWDADAAGRVAETRGLIDFGGGTADVDAVDGLLLVLSPWAVRNLRFDEASYDGFHGYDIDVCFQARAAGRRVLVDEIDLFHHTKGGYGDTAAFERADQAWRRKWIAPGVPSAHAEASDAPETSEASRPRAAGIRDGVDGPLGLYYDGPRADLAALVPADARRILDVGCGTGSLAASLKAQLGAEVAGIELLPEAAAVARDRLDHFLQADLDALEDLPFPERFFDVAMFGDVLEHLRDPLRLLRTIRPHLTPDGRIICSIPNVKHWSVLLPLLVEDRFTYTDAGLLDRTHVHFFTLEEAGRMLAEAGFDVVSLDAHRVPMPAHAEPLKQAVAAFGGDVGETVARLEAYQYLVVARPT